jgi:hypothetical protein
MWFIYSVTLVLLSTHSKPYVSYCLYPLERQKSQTREQDRMQKQSAQSQSIPKSLEQPVINTQVQVTKPKLQAKEVGEKLNNNLKNKVEVSNNTTSIKQNKGRIVGK